MDVAVLGSKSLKLKGKKSSLIINPTGGISKTEAEGIVITSVYDDKNYSKVEGQRIVITGAGEYEVGGIKISANEQDKKLVCLIDVDNVKILVGDGESIEKVYEKIENCNIVIVYTDQDFNEGILAKIEPNVILLFGDKKEEVGKSLGKDSIEKISKYSVTAEKLPEDLQVYLLG